ncbi:MAG: hypothetical protein IPK80_02795 [Nannocystis sp.]|nr:hypothetical protein [Nannocystis sp.]
MAAITDLSDLISLSSGGGSAAPQNPWFFKQARIAGAAATAPIAGRPASLWRYDGAPAGGAVPTTVEAPTNATVGAIPITSPGGGRELFLTQAWATGLVGGTLILYDRLLHIGGLDATNASPQTVGGTLTRYTDGAGNFVMAEIYTIIGTTARNITMSYTDQDGNSGQTSVAAQIGATGFREVTRAIYLPLASGDTGVQAVASVDLDASTGTAGNFGVTVGHPLAYIGIGTSGAPGWRDFVTGLPGIPTVGDDACLSLLWIPVTTTVPEIVGGLGIVEK